MLKLAFKMLKLARKCRRGIRGSIMVATVRAFGNSLTFPRQIISFPRTNVKTNLITKNPPYPYPKHCLCDAIVDHMFTAEHGLCLNYPLYLANLDCMNLGRTI